MKRNPEVAIILPNYNSHLFLQSTIKSIINQRYVIGNLLS